MTSRGRHGARPAGVLLVCVAIALSLALPAAGSPALSRGKVVVLVIDRISVSDLGAGSTPFLDRLAERWSIGLMVTHSAQKEAGREPDLSAAFVTLSAGVRARGAKDAGLSLDASEAAGPPGRTAAGYYLAETGTDVPDGGVACLGMPGIVRANEKDGNDENVGLLAGTLLENGRVPAVAGGQDSFNARNRPSALIAADPSGVVRAGRVAGMSVPSTEPGGRQTDYALLAAESSRLLSAADTLVIETGDTGRIDRESRVTSVAKLKAARARALKRADAFAEEVASSLDFKDSLLLVVSPSARTDRRKVGDYSTPFIAAGKGFGRGFLTSPSTRREGIVNNADFPGTVLGFYGIETPGGSSGAAMETLGRKPPAGGQLAALKGLDSRFETTRTVRAPIVLGYLLTMCVFLLLSLACIPAIAEKITAGRPRKTLARLLSPASVVLVAAPVSFLLVSALRFSGIAVPLAFCLGYSLLVGLGAWFLGRRNSRLDPFTLACSFSTAVILVDMVFGGRLLVLPLLGSSSLEGARFFGMSNAVAGLFIASGTWAVAGLAGDDAVRRPVPRVFALAALTGLAFAAGFGLLGANFGAFVAAITVALIFYFATSTKGFAGWRVPAIAAAACIATAIMVVVDSLFIHTHAGHAVASGSESFVPMLGRKLLILLAQIKTVLFLAVLMIAVVIALALWMKGRSPLWRASWAEHPAFSAALFSISIGSIAALLFNDTGIAMMGAMVMVSVPAVVFHFSGLSTPKISPG